MSPYGRFKKLFVVFYLDDDDCGHIKPVSLLKDGELKLLAKSLPFITQHGRAQSTGSKYKSGWLGWVKWSESKEEVKTRPAEPFFVALYLNHLYFIRNNKGSITTAFYGIRWAHHMVGLSSPTDNELVQLAYEGCLRLCGGKGSGGTLFQSRFFAIFTTDFLRRIQI